MIGVWFLNYVPYLLYYLILLRVIRKYLGQLDGFPCRTWVLAFAGYPAFLLAFYFVMSFTGWSPFAWGIAYHALDLALKIGSFALTIYAIVLLARWIARNAASPHPLCPVCRYDLTGLDRPRCPECGTHFEIETRYLARTMRPPPAGT